MQGIYCLIHQTQQFVIYVGQSKNTTRRVEVHLRDLKNGRHHNRWLQRVANKHGVAFDILDLEEITQTSELSDAETFWTDQFRAWGFNVTNKTTTGHHPNRGCRCWTNGAEFTYSNIQPGPEWQPGDPKSGWDSWVNVQTNECRNAQTCPGSDWIKQGRSVGKTWWHSIVGAKLVQQLSKESPGPDWIQGLPANQKTMWQCGDQFTWSVDQPGLGWKKGSPIRGKRWWVLPDGSQKLAENPPAPGCTLRPSAAAGTTKWWHPEKGFVRSANCPGPEWIRKDPKEGRSHWINSLTNERKITFECPGPEWLNTPGILLIRGNERKWVVDPEPFLVDGWIPKRKSRR